MINKEGIKILSQKAFMGFGEERRSSKLFALVVEDEKPISNLIRTWLEIKGYEVIIANNGKEAIDLLKNNNFSIITTDIKMPIMDGVEFISKIKSNPSTYHIPVVVVSIVDKSDIGNFFADAYLKKPFDGLDLLEVIENLV